MSKQKFTDPKTGEEIESTWLAQFAQVLFLAPIWVLLGLVLFSNPQIDKITDYFVAIAIMVVLFIVAGLCFLDGRSEKYPWLHDTVARWQHNRRR